MECAASHGHLGHRGQQKTRDQVRHACDGCRIRKVRCHRQPRPTELCLQEETPQVPPDGGLVQAQIMLDSPPKCLRCLKLGLSCSFNLPVQRRGPKASGRKHIESMDLQLHTSLSKDSPTTTSPQALPFSQTTPNLFSNEAMSDVLGDTSTLGFNNHVRGESVWGSHGYNQADGGHPTSIRSPSTPGYAMPLSLATSQQNQYLDGDLFPAELIPSVVNDFLVYVYPIVQLVHRPTFLRNFRDNKHAQDPNFFALVMALCALTVAHRPEKLVEYQNASTPLRMQSPLELVDYCYARSVQWRSAQYYDEVSHTKWTAAFMFYTSFSQVGDVNKARMMEMEAILFARLLELHRTSAYTGLNCIEVQLRKKAFGFMMHAYVHHELQNIRKERVAFIDCSTLHEIDLEELLPAPQDDEDITENTYGPYDITQPSLAAALRFRIELFLTAVTEITSKNRRGSKGAHCRCTRLIDPASYVKHLYSRLHELKYKLDGAPWYLRQWAPKELGEEVSRDKEFQIGLLRADIHTTHLWLQTCMLNHLEYLKPAPGALSLPSPQEVLHLVAGSQWEQREEVCRQMLQVLSLTPHIYLEILGIYLIHKIRDVASPLFSLLDENGENPTSPGFHDRVKQYLKEYSEKLRHLDRSGKPNFESLQTWVDTDRV